MPSKIITFTLNGREIEVLARPLVTLQTLLREQLQLTAVKSGCKQGGCGSCTVLLNGQPVLSCLLPVEDVAGQQVTTLEGIGGDGALHPVQQAFFDEYAIQCGYCTPGMIMTSVALLNQTPHPERAQFLEALTGNFCRCTGYEPIVRAIQEAARRSDEQD